MEKDNKIITANLPEIKEVYKAPIIEIVEVQVEGIFQDDDLDTSSHTY